MPWFSCSCIGARTELLEDKDVKTSSRHERAGQIAGGQADERPAVDPRRRSATNPMSPPTANIELTSGFLPTTFVTVPMSGVPPSPELVDSSWVSRLTDEVRSG